MLGEGLFVHFGLNNFFQRVFFSLDFCRIPCQEGAIELLLAPR